MTVWLNRCIWNSTTNGLSDFIVGSAAQDGYTPAQCLDPVVVNGGTYHYFAAQGSDHEEGDGVFTVATLTLTRTTIRNSSNGGAKVNFHGHPVVTMGGPIATDLGGSVVGGSNTQVQFNNSNSFDGSANLIWVDPKLTIGAGSADGELALYTPAVGGNPAGTTTFRGNSANGLQSSYIIELPTSLPPNQSLLAGTDIGGGVAATSWFDISSNLLTQPTDTNGIIIYNGSGATRTVSPDLLFDGSVLTLIGSSGNLDFVLATKTLEIYRTAYLIDDTFSTLPVSPALGMIATVNDSTVNIWGTPITIGGGGFKVMAFYNGTNWTVMGA